MQVALQVAYWVGHMAWAESDTARLVLQLLGFPKARSGWDVTLVCPPPPPNPHRARVVYFVNKQL